MKISTHFLFGIMIMSMFKRTEEDNTAMDHCATTHDNTVLCYKNDKNVIPVIPDDIPLNIKRFILRNEHSNIPWLIHSTETFKRFPKLQSLIIRSSVQFAPEFQKPEPKHILTEELFDLPELVNLTLFNCSFEGISEVLWTLPVNLERFYLINSTVGKFNLKNCPKLQELVIESGNLTEMPELYYPPSPPLHTMNLKGNPHLHLTVKSLAILCNLSRISFDKVGGYLGSAEGFCDCNELKSWHQWLTDINVNVDFDISSEWKCSSEKIECETHSLEIAKGTYKEICLEEDPQEAFTPKMIIGFWAYFIPMVLIVFSIALAIVLYTMSKLQPTPKVEAMEEHENEIVEEEHSRES